MAFERKTWIDRQAEFPARRKLNPTGTADVYDVSRDEGLILEEGDPFNAATMNALEGRIEAALNDTILPATCTYSSGVFTLSGLPDNLPDIFTVRFKAPSDFAEGDTFAIGSTTLQAKLIDMEDAKNYTFRQDGIVSANVDRINNAIFFTYISSYEPPKEYKVFGVSIDLANGNPATAVTYTDDAVGMTAGSAAWDSQNIFKDIKPCVLKNGVVQYYLNPNDFTKKADGTASDITSGDAGDVMIEIPKTGFKINTSGNTLTIKVTDNPAAGADEFKYYAHTRSSEGDKSKLYIGAYLGWKDGSNKLRSLSGKTPQASQTIGTFRTQAQANGSGYDIVSFYPLTLLQCLFMIKYKNRDSQTALGRGFVDGNSAAVATGGTNTKGIDFGETTGKQQMCFLNIEDMWGNLRWFIDGFFSDASRNMLTAFTGFNDTGSGYTNRGQGATADIGNYMSKPQGTTEAGFVAKEVSGSATTHFTDNSSLYASRLTDFGGDWGAGDFAGVFCLTVYRAADYSSSYFGARLMYL